MDLYWAGSDWLTLASAAELCAEVLSSEKTPDDVIKAGYVKYDGIRQPLRICTFARQPIEIRPAEPMLPAFPWRDPLTDHEKKISFRALNPGDIFELHSTILERTLLLRHWKTSGEIAAVIRAYSVEELPQWNHHPSPVQGGNGHWTAVFDGVITPDIEIRWEDLRVDRQELLGFLEEAKQARVNGIPSSAVDRVEGSPTAISASGDEWKDAARKIADKIGAERWARGEREITGRNICNAVATELAKNPKYHGTRGPRSGSIVRNGALNGWKFTPPPMA